jgi:hypothetical protein
MGDAKFSAFRNPEPKFTFGWVLLQTVVLIRCPFTHSELIQIFSFSLILYGRYQINVSYSLPVSFCSVAGPDSVGTSTFWGSDSDLDPVIDRTFRTVTFRLFIVTIVITLDYMQTHNPVKRPEFNIGH